MSKPELKPCPFCGSAEALSIIHADSGTWWVACYCGANVKSFMSEESVIYKWNTRKEQPNDK